MTTRQTDPAGGIASLIREARRGAGLTQDELAALVGVARSTVSRWEAGEAKPGRERLAALALHCGTGGLELAECEAPGRAGMSPEERMSAVVGAIARHRAEHGYPPSMRELKRETGFRSLSVVKSWLDKCEEAGLVVRARRRAAPAPGSERRPPGRPSPEAASPRASARRAGSRTSPRAHWPRSSACPPIPSGPGRRAG